MTIKTKKDAKLFLMVFHDTFEDNDFYDGMFWYRYDGAENHDYTINHEEEGIIGVSTEEVISYIYRNRKRINRIFR